VGQPTLEGEHWKASDKQLEIGLTSKLALIRCYQQNATDFILPRVVFCSLFLSSNQTVKFRKLPVPYLEAHNICFQHLREVLFKRLVVIAGFFQRCRQPIDIP
jgi:hypothetical protein